ncbi:MAG: DEAD/DEAH box helicase, partial [Parcubacteria group bacterium]|nr:DEAD/DEAH box helicase [Parcubacteria group bacterium]
FKKHMHLATGIIQDASGSLRVLWFNQPYITTTLKKGERVCLTGKILRDKQGLYLSNPAYELLDGRERLHTGRIIPIYQETAGVSSKWLRRIIWDVIKSVPKEDVLPRTIVQERGLLSFSEALYEMHFPSNLKRIEQAQMRFAFEELFVISLFVLSERKKLARVKAHMIPLNKELMARFTKSLPFRLTDAQKKAAWNILKDLEKPRPMNRLLQGDVGSGKTVVAAMAALAAAKAGLQTVFMAPTLLSTFKLQVGLLTGKTDQYISPKLPKEPIEISRTKLMQKTLQGDIDVLIGTQALIQDRVKFGKLALVVLDEQHRFGVNQRAP